MNGFWYYCKQNGPINFLIKKIRTNDELMILRNNCTLYKKNSQWYGLNDQKSTVRFLHIFVRQLKRCTKETLVFEQLLNFILNNTWFGHFNGFVNGFLPGGNRVFHLIAAWNSIQCIISHYAMNLNFTRNMDQKGHCTDYLNRTFEYIHTPHPIGNRQYLQRCVRHC